MTKLVPFKSMELRQSPMWGKYLESLGWQTEIIDGCALRIKKLGPLGSIIKIQRPEVLPLEKIEAFAKKTKALFVKIEPLNETQTKSLITNHYSLDTWPLTPARTVFLDLTQSEEDLLKSFSKDTRQSIRKSRISNIEYRIVELSENLFTSHPKNATGGSLPFVIPVETGIQEPGSRIAVRDDVAKDLYKIWKQTGARGGFWVPSFSEFLSEVSAFSGSGFFALSLLENRHLVSGCLILLCDGVAYYHHAASTLEGQNLHSPYGQMWRAILESKRRGCTKMDLEGIFDPRFKDMFKKWLNFSAFKLKWGGEVFEYPGSFTKAFNPVVRLLLKFSQ